ncbi:MAG TPA: ribokinase [Phycisphaerae bacterium]|jgi:ribokinase|nr:ribokinase [Phycisphaerae bacterium]HOB75186.1 ribokinase [Phycisphaerae bacterium]HOJ54667.1 ribokinase [Phycisphaerae bacterium]HOL25983.1 ribokinase [Phycisphaerae bacterium]HPP19445.1 ribokinase [Phycisphaerae bacterium]
MASNSSSIVIVGSINMDLVVRAPHVPALGETVLGREFATIPGGKGANQAVGVARLGAQAIMIGRVGGDDVGERLLAGLRANGVDTTHVQTTPEVASGIAMIVVADDGENAITVAGGANLEVTPADVDAAEDALRGARVCLLQLELPMPTVLHTIERCRRLGVEIILDPAPAPAGAAPDGLFAADIITPNESEAAQLTGLRPDADPAEIVRAITTRGCRTVVLKRGAQGAHLYSTEGNRAVPGFAVQPVDTTAAGDAFTAALAVARARDWPLDQAVRFANAAGALACTRLGAQPSLPRAEEVDRLLAGQA